MWKEYRKKGTTQMRSYIPGENLTGISVSERDTPAEGDMIARNPKKEGDFWLVSAAYFRDNYEPV